MTNKKERQFNLIKKNSTGSSGSVIMVEILSYSEDYYN